MMRYPASWSSLVVHWTTFSAKESRVGIGQLDGEVVETVASVVRLLRRAAELAWVQADEGGPLSWRQLHALGIDSAADEASSLLPRRARLEGPTPVGQNPAGLLASAEQLLHQICIEGAPSRLLSLRALVGELIWKANTVPARDRRVVGELLPDSDAVSREMFFEVSSSQRPATVRWPPLSHDDGYQTQPTCTPE